MTTSSAASPAASPHNEFTSGTLLVLFTVIIWGLQFPVAKAAFESVNAWHAAVFRFSIPAFILLVAMLVREGWSTLKTGQVDVGRLLGRVVGVHVVERLSVGHILKLRGSV